MALLCAGKCLNLCLVVFHCTMPSLSRIVNKKTRVWAAKTHILPESLRYFLTRKKKSKPTHSHEDRLYTSRTDVSFRFYISIKNKNLVVDDMELPIWQSCIPLYRVLSKEMRSAKLRFATIKILMAYAHQSYANQEECDKAHRGRLVSVTLFVSRTHNPYTHQFRGDTTLML